MIKFFRHNRQGYISEGKNTKYFKYVIGEIVLVVIGILIALQINNWNDQRKLKQQEQTYYCKISEDLKTDIENINRTLVSLKERKITAKRLLINLLSIQNDKTILLQDYLGALRAYDYIPTKAAILGITSSGKLENLKNSALKNEILHHYSEQDYAIKIIDKNDDPIFQKIFSYGSYTDFGINEIPSYKDEYSPELSALLKSTEWQRDPNSTLFKHIKDHMNMTIILCSREQQLLGNIKISSETLFKKMSTYCQ
ncbi:MAG: DUF6090 family protein [Psychroserpens sp.]|uniref:DUF6090 family protein n=1 Tax=Psychroserpens sp. TaxID=2020870 RepID=UPI003C7796C4